MIHTFLGVLFCFLSNKRTKFMDKYSGKKTSATRITAAPRKEHNIDTDQNARICNRIGCSGRIKYTTQSTKTIKISEKAKSSTNPSLCSSSNGNETTGKSPSSSCATPMAKGSIADSKRKLSSRSETSQSGDSEAQSLPAWRPAGKNSSAIGRSIIPSNVGPRKILQKKMGSINKSACPASRSSGLGTLSNSTASSSDRSRVNLRNIKSDSIKDVSSSSSSSTASRPSEKNPIKKRSQLGDNVNNGAASSVTRQGVTNVNNGRTRFSCGGQNGRNISRLPVNSSRQNLGNRPLSSSSSYSSSSSSCDDNRSNMMAASATGWNIPHFDHMQGYNIDPEVLLTLERIQRDEEVRNEQIYSMEESLFLSAVNMSDQHRAMRLDIDNMSYEELLALEEVMGSVSTALPEEEIVQCISRSVYQTTPSEVRVVGSGEDEDDFKCTICQEEYVGGDEIGKLVKCQHGFHTACINEWLRLKNWCPVCKAAAAAPPS